VYPQRVPVVRSAGPGRTVGKPTDAPRGRNDGPPSILAPTASRRAAILPAAPPHRGGFWARGPASRARAHQLRICGRSSVHTPSTPR